MRPFLALLFACAVSLPADAAANAGRVPDPWEVCASRAAEAERKAKDKGVDLLVANDVSAPGSEFGSDHNEVTLIWPDGNTEPWELMTKREVAGRLLDRIREAKA